MSRSLAERLAEVDERIAAAALESGRDPGEITRIVVTKVHPATLITDLSNLGVRDVGESRQQELTAKIAELGASEKLDALRWHMVGQLQSNKARAIARAAARVPLTVHTIDRARLAESLGDALAEEGVDEIDALIQVNLTDDPRRGGVMPGGAARLALEIAQTDRLRLRGTMAIAPLHEDPAPAFARLAQIAAEVRQAVPAATWISAGMTGDFEAAIRAGATHLRIGTAITGNRPDRS